MKKLVVVIAALFSSLAFSAEEVASRLCVEHLRSLPGTFSEADLTAACSKAKVIDGCSSVRNIPIYHVDATSQATTPQRVLVFALIHGDEKDSGSVARQWMIRLANIQSRSSWRIVPVLNPDGLKDNTRTNANGIDINRNFPSKDWEQSAGPYWETKAKKDQRRFPGKEAGSEPETQCAMKHIEDFKPDFIISMHTPYGVLDFDGPQVAFPNFQSLPWVSLGTFPGSLGRYMWVDKKVPVLTIELKDGRILQDVSQVEFLQDMAGTVAIRANKKLYNEARK